MTRTVQARAMSSRIGQLLLCLQASLFVDGYGDGLPSSGCSHGIPGGPSGQHGKLQFGPLSLSLLASIYVSWYHAQDLNLSTAYRVRLEERLS